MLSPASPCDAGFAVSDELLSVIACQPDQFLKDSTPVTNPLHGDSLFNGLIDEAAYAQTVLPLLRAEPDLFAELLEQLQTVGEVLQLQLRFGDPDALHDAAITLAHSAACLAAARLADIARRLARNPEAIDDDDHLGSLIEPLLAASLAELRHRAS